MQTFRIEIAQRAASRIDHPLLRVAHQLGIQNLHGCLELRLFFLQGNLTMEDAARIGTTLLADAVIEVFTLTAVNAQGTHTTLRELPADLQHQIADFSHAIEVTLLPGVTDAVAENLVRAVHLPGITTLERAGTGQRYLLWGTLTADEVQRLATEVFANAVIQRWTIDEPIAAPFIPVQHADETVETIPISNADDEALRDISATRRLALNLEEMQAIRAYFQQECRDPTDAELETLAQTWSEHCVHKTFKAVIEYTEITTDPLQGERQTTTTIDGLLRTYIRGATEHLAKPWVRSAFVDNAGLIAFDDAWDLAFKVETHNRPSALEPFGGANTGVGGVVRDILGVSAHPIANTDVLCFGPPDLPETQVPAGLLHPRRIADGVVHGIEDYGNKMGIPTVNGAVVYHPGYTSNPLVFCGCLGLLPRDSHPSHPQAGDLIVVIGGRTGRDGLRGATFSSMELDQHTSTVAGSAVQIGHPINEKQVMEVVIRARDEQLYHAITDCGAGGLASAVGEMGQHIGARVQLDRVPLKYAGLRPWEIWLSEAQERMVLSVPPRTWERLQAVCAGQDVEVVCIGVFEATERLQLFYGERMVGDLAMAFLHDGLPQRHMQAVWRMPAAPPPATTQQPVTDAPLSPQERGSRSSGSEAMPQPAPGALNQVLCDLLGHDNIRSREPIIRRYDHEVQGATVLKPLVGVANHGPGDATVLLPLPAPFAAAPIQGVAVGAGICPAYSEIDPYMMAWAAVDEALRNVVCVGADPQRVAILDNFCWGNPTLPDRLGSLVRCAQGCYDAAVAYGVPFISGKDSLNNEYSGADGRRHAIPGTLLISALGIVTDARHSITMNLKQAGNLLYLVGDTRAELGGSHYQMIAGSSGDSPAGSAAWNRLPQPVPGGLERLRVLHRAITTGVVRACHDCSEGGLGVAVAEMCLAGRLGAEIDLAAVRSQSDMAAASEAPLADDVLLFSESLCRMVVEVRAEDAPAFEALLSSAQDVPYARIGTVQAAPVDEPAKLCIRGRTGAEIVRISVTDLEVAWRGTVAEQHRATDTDTATPPLTPPAYSALTSSSPRVIILHANGTNRDREAARACEWAGGLPEIVHINQLLVGEYNLLDYHMLVLPGGFSYGDTLGAGTLWALDMQYRLEDEMRRFATSGRPVLGICNGFQALVKAGLLPGSDASDTPTAGALSRDVTLAANASGHFECRWVYLRPEPSSRCLFTEGLDELIYCPVAHGEGRLVASSKAALTNLQTSGLVALTYADADGNLADYPHNPNGSALGIAGICNRDGTILGLMPHPEDHIFVWQHPRWHRGESGMVGLHLFMQGIRRCKQ